MKDIFRLDTIYKIKIMALFKNTVQYYISTGNILAEDKVFLIIKCHDKFYEIKLELSCKTNDENLFYKVTDIDEISDIKSYMLTRRTNKYKVYLPNETELIKYNKKIKIKNNTYNTQSFIFANNCFIYNCDEEDVVILNESNFKLV